MEIYRDIWYPGRTDIDSDELDEAAKVRADQLALTPWHPILWSQYGNILVRSGRLEEARTALERATHLGWDDEETFSSALYDLACLHARQGREYTCRACLTEALRMRGASRQQIGSDQDLAAILTEARRTRAAFRQQMGNDPDLAVMRGRRWFDELRQAGAGAKG